MKNSPVRLIVLMQVSMSLEKACAAIRRKTGRKEVKRGIKKTTPLKKEIGL